MNAIGFFFMAVVTTLFVLYAQGVRRAYLSGRAIVFVGLAVGAVALLGVLLILSPSMQRGLPLPALLINVGGMALCTAYCILMAQRQARVEEAATEGKLALLVTTPYRLKDLDALILPTSTRLRSLFGPSGPLLSAGGKTLVKEIDALGIANLDKVIATGAGTLGVGKLLHIVAYEPDDIRVDAGKLKKGLQAALLAARKDGQKVVGLAYAPLRGIGEKDVAKMYVQAAKKYENDFEKIVLVLLDGRGEAAFKAALTPAV